MALCCRGPAAGVAVADGIGTVSFTECHFDQVNFAIF